MSSSKANDKNSSTFSSGKIVVDPEAVLVREPGLIVDPRFLGPLREELTSELGAAGALTAMMQIGCMHGLRDADSVVTATFSAPAGVACAPGTSALPLRLKGDADTDPTGNMRVSGTWPEASEAQSWLATLPASEQPVCAVSAGYTSGWLSGLFERDIVTIETECKASGAPQCRFVAFDRVACLASGDPIRIARAEVLPIDALRYALSVPAPGNFLPEVPEGNEQEAVIHIWGPVMVIPFGGLDEALQAVALLRTDASASHVSVIVMDVTGAIIDEGFGAAQLEQIIDCAAASGAETVLAGVSPLSEDAVAGLEHPPVLICKDLHAGIAAGFQVADSQQRVV